MHRIDRRTLLNLFGDCSTTPECLHSYEAARQQYSKATTWADDVLDNIIKELQRNDIPVPTAHLAARRVKEVFLDLTKGGLTVMNDSHERFLKIVALKQELAELKCQILEVETESEILDLQRAIIRKSRSKNITESISYLDLDGE